MAITTYRKNNDYPTNFNKIILGQQFLQNTIIDLDFRQKEISIAPKNEFTSLESLDFSKSELITVIGICIFTILVLVFVLICRKNCKNASDTDSTMRTNQKRDTFGETSLRMDTGSSEDSYNNFSVKFEKKSKKRKETIE